MGAALAAPGSPALRRFRRHRLAMFGAGTLLFLVVACTAGPWLNPHDDTTLDVMNRFAPPLSGTHLLGTDELGRDMLARLLSGGQVSLLVGFTAMAIGLAIGTLVGAVAGYRGGWPGAALMRLVDAMLCFPTIFLLLALAALVQPGLLSIIILIAATSWMDVARIVEGQVRALRGRDFALAAEAMGATDRHIILKELLPNALAPIVVVATLSVARAILLESYVSFLGYGIQPPLPSWGNMLNNAQIYLTSTPMLAILPGLAITLAVTACNFLGDGLRDALDPRMRAG